MCKRTFLIGACVALLGCHGGDQGSYAELRDASFVDDMDTGAVDGGMDDALDATTADADMLDGDTGGSNTDAGSADGDPPEAIDCRPPTECAGGRDLGEFSGDQAAFNAQLVATGTTSEWLLLRVTEDARTTKDLAIQVTMTPGDGGNYDLFAYFTGDDTACDLVAATLSASNASSQPEELTLGWTDHFASDETRIVALEVRHVDGGCTGWELDVRAP